MSTAISEPPAPVINVKDHGAIGDGSTDNTEAIAKAIAACPAGGSVVFDEGVYMTGSITLKGNMTLWVSENAVIRAIQDNDKIQTYPEAGFAGESFVKHFLFGNRVDNLTITGGGTIDGNSVDGYLVSPKHYRPVLLGFINSKNVTVTNLDLIYSHSWLFIPRLSDNVIIDGINIHNTHKDGIAPLDCHDIFITNTVISSGDDALTPKSYDARGIDNLVVKNLTINHCKWKGIKFGFSSIGDFTNWPLLGNQWARTRGECPPRCTFSTVYPPNGPVHFCVRVQDWRGISSGRQREPESAPDAQVTFQRWSPSLRKRISTHPLVFVKSHKLLV